MATVTARRLNQEPSAVKELARHEPVFVTERGREAFVILSVETYEQLVGSNSVHDSLRMEAEFDIEFEPVVNLSPSRPANL